MIISSFPLLVLAALISGNWSAATPLPNPGTPPEEERLPAAFALMMSPTKEGVFVRMPYFDTDPNRGLTYGVMPVWVSIGKDNEIRDIHIPTLTYNKYMGVSVGYEHYRFLSPEKVFHFQSAISQKYERGATVEYLSDDLTGHVEYSRDASKRFYGLGPTTPKSGESNYTLDSLNYLVSGRLPLRDGVPLWAVVTHELQANEVRPGAITAPDDLVNVYPAVAAETRQRHRDASLRGALSYDTRDSATTTSRGQLAEVFVSGAHDGVLGQYSYYRYGIKLKEFFPSFHKDESEPAFITAARFRFEQLEGDAPFWALPSMGGKYWHRGYGEGRYTDHGMTLIGAEERCRVYARKISGVPASFWVDPFVDLGTVFHHPEDLQIKYVRPAPGIALRAVGRPQIVGSADFGYGQDGLKVFLDINYAF